MKNDSLIEQNLDQESPAYKHKTAARERFHALPLFFIAHLRAFIFSLGELIRAPLATLITLLVIGVAMALPTALYLLLHNFQTLGSHWSGSPTISLYLEKNINKTAVNSLIQQIQKTPEVSKVSYISPQQGLAEFERLSQFNHMLQTLQSNPLPGVLVITPHEAKHSPVALEKLFQSVKTLPHVALAQLDQRWVKRLYYLVQLGNRILYTLVFLFGVGVILITSNTIRLTTQSHRHEITLLKLLGATHAFIRRPLLYRGTLYGLLGGGIACILVSLMLKWLENPAQQLAASYGNLTQLKGLNLPTASIILLSCAALGLIGAWLALAKYLRAPEGQELE